MTATREETRQVRFWPLTSFFLIQDLCRKDEAVRITSRSRPLKLGDGITLEGKSNGTGTFIVMPF